MFSLDTFADRTFLMATGASIVTLVLATVFEPLRALLDTHAINARLWAICFLVACSVVVASRDPQADPPRTRSADQRDCRAGR